MSPAKINLHLDVRERRDDGFHELISLFQMIDLEDHIHIRSLKKQNFCEIEGNFPVVPEDNIMYRAYKGFAKMTGCHKGIRIKVKKKIPWGAGLGGGSSNAAAVLLACDTLFETNLGRDALMKLAASLGSDVPFFLQGPAALVTGRGEKIESLKERTDFFVVLVVPDFRIPTVEAYRWLDTWRVGKGMEGSKYLPEKEEKGRIKREYQYGKIEDWDFFNGFSPVLYHHFPKLLSLVRELKTHGAVHSAVSGSGSAVFGVFLDKKMAKNTAESMKNHYTSIWVVVPKRIRFEVKAL